MTLPANILDQDQIAAAMGYERVGDAEKKLIEQGIRPIYGRRGCFFVTIDMLNAARGVGTASANSEELF